MENKKLMDRIRENPKRAKITQKVNVSWISKYKSKVKVRGHEFIIDEPKSVAGDDTGPAPTELLLASIAGCELSVLSREAYIMGLQIEKAEIEIEGILDIRGFMGIAGPDGLVSPGFQNIKLVIKITSPESREKIDELIKIVDKRCPALNTFRNPPEIEISYKIN